MKKNLTFIYSTLWLFTVAILISFISNIEIKAQMVLDPTFGVQGIFNTDLTGQRDTPMQIELLPDGKLLVGGFSDINQGIFRNIAFIKLLPNGQLDTTFGTGGKVSFRFSSDGSDAIFKFVVNNNKIIAVGSSREVQGGKFIPTLYKFNDNGSIDTTFGNSGRVFVPFFINNSAHFSDLIVLPDGKILAAGLNFGGNSGNPSGFGIMKFNVDGTLDSTFSGDGKLILNNGVPGAVGNVFVGILRLDNGDLILSGGSFDGINNNFCLAKCDSLGNMITSFGNFGVLFPNIIVFTSFNIDNNTIRKFDNSSFLCAVTTGSGNDKQFTVVKFFNNGTIDTSFGVNGFANVNFTSGGDFCASMTMNELNQITLFGQVDIGNNVGGLARFNSDGTPDTTFGTNGKVILDLNGAPNSTNYLSAGALKSDSVVFVCGFDFHVGNGDFAVAKLIKSNSVPVELTSFSAQVNDNTVKLHWQTATELNNMGFEIERSFLNGSWEKIAFVVGNGTSTLVNNYYFTDILDNPSGVYYYRLKQIDHDGTYKYSNEIEVDFKVPVQFHLFQNYPNPFNPATIISWQSPVSDHQILKIYDILGNEVVTLVNEYREAGKHKVEFDASNIPSGIYYYKVTAGSFSDVKKMILIK